MKSELFTPLFGEYLPKNIYAVYGVPNVGKTLLAMTEVANLQTQGIRVLWIDTEGGLNFEGGAGVWEAWKPKLEKRFSIKDLNGEVEYHSIMDYEELMNWLNFPVNVQYDEKKIVVQPQARPKRLEGTVYETFGRKQDNCFIVVDSISSLFRLQFGSTMQNFPGRGDATGYLIFALERLMKKTNSPMLTVNHASLNPQKPWEMASMRGGNTVAYYSKNITYLEKPKRRVLDTYRKCWAVRSPYAKEWGNSCWLHIDGDMGFVSCDNAEVEGIIAADKKGKETEEE